MNIKQEIRTCKKNFTAEKKKMKQWIKDPQTYITHSCGDERENVIANAVYEFGKLHILWRLEQELTK